ncbi:MAG: polysaccharide deacetylase family protein [Lachnospiraceae bacterium]|nr:polysaccharide deacetylase family protein [Lachnospiraceae bacterium]
MKKLKKWMVVFWVFAVMFLSSALAVQAKTVNAKTYELKDVRKAERPEGSWDLKNSVVRFVQEDGTIVKNRWIRVDNHIYYMDSKGKRVTGWVKYRGQLYYLKDTGVHKGWLKLNGKVYYFNANGTMAKGLRVIKNKKYFFNKTSGARVTGWVKIGQDQYYFSPGKYYMVTSTWLRSGKKYYYVGADGKKKKSGWLAIGEAQYYLGKDGARATGTVYMNGKGYYFKKNGVYDPTVVPEPQIDSSKPMVALTFDDGPGAYTGRLLDCLQKNQARATFFMVGTNVSRYSSTVKRMAEMGCELGNHSYSHPYFTSLSTSGMRSQVSTTSNLIRNASGKYPTLFRLPYGDGASNSTVLSALGLPSIYWSIDTRDWANTGNPQHTINEVLNHVQSGDIVLMHDIHYNTVVAAETIIPALKKRGYQLVTVSQLAKYKGKTTLSAGRTYYKFR